MHIMIGGSRGSVPGVISTRYGNVTIVGRSVTQQTRDNTMHNNAKLSTLDVSLIIL